VASLRSANKGPPLYSTPSCQTATNGVGAQAFRQTPFSRCRR